MPKFKMILTGTIEVVLEADDEAEARRILASEINGNTHVETLYAGIHGEEQDAEITTAWHPHQPVVAERLRG